VFRRGKLIIININRSHAHRTHRQRKHPRHRHTPSGRRTSDLTRVKVIIIIIKVNPRDGQAGRAGRAGKGGTVERVLLTAPPLGPKDDEDLCRLEEWGGLHRASSGLPTRPIICESMATVATAGRY